MQTQNNEELYQVKTLNKKIIARYNYQSKNTTNEFNGVIFQKDDTLTIFEQINHNKNLKQIIGKIYIINKNEPMIEQIKQLLFGYYNSINFKLEYK